MTDVRQLSVSWSEYHKNICTGLSSLQQRGEFVDMTLAADGHHVKVHKMVLSLASSYIKELIASADTAHPIIFLNQISYSTLCLILEYIYTGEVVVPRENFKSFMEAGRALYIKGLQNKSLQHYRDETSPIPSPSGITERSVDMQGESLMKDTQMYSNLSEEHSVQEYIEMDAFSEYDNLEDNPPSETSDGANLLEMHNIKQMQKEDKKPSVQYSLSNQGNLQLVMNRYLYNLRYASRNTSQRRWQCIDGHWKGHRCPAYVVTQENTVLRRTGVHNHPFHDRKILMKTHDGVIYSGINDAEEGGKLVHKKKEKMKKLEANDNKD